MATAINKTCRFLTSAQIMRLHQRIIATADPSQPAMLESAVASPMTVKNYEKEENIFQLAANLAEKIMKNHAYLDGNKRTALVAADMFLKMNGYKLQRTPLADDEVKDGIAKAHIAVVTSKWDAKKLGEYYESIATPIESSTEEITEFRNGGHEY